MWRDTGRKIRFFIFDGRLTIFLFIFAFHISYFTLGMAVFAMIFFYLLEYKGYSLSNASRKLGVMVVGKSRPAVHWWRRRRLW